MTASSASQTTGKSGPNLLLIGPPGAGKGTLAAKLRSLNLEHVSSGAIFRAEVAGRTPLGCAIEKSLARGEFVPDDATLAVMRKWYFGRKTSRRFLLDGFPRNLLQAQVFGEWLEARKEVLGAVVYLDLSLEEALRRITGRRVCPLDGSVYHQTDRPPIAEGRCDRCGEILVQRPDDTEETVRYRWGLFEDRTRPLVDFYRNQNLLLAFDASVSAEDLERAVGEKVERLF